MTTKLGQLDQFLNSLINGIINQHIEEKEPPFVYECYKTLLERGYEDEFIRVPLSMPSTKDSLSNMKKWQS